MAKLTRAFILFFLIIVWNNNAMAGHIYYNSKGEKINTDTHHTIGFSKKDKYYIIGQSGKKYKLSKQALEVVEGKYGPFSGLVEEWQTTTSEEGLLFRTAAAISGYHPENESVLAYVLKESRDVPGCKMNQKVNLSKTRLYVFNDCAYNSNEAGNVIWGAAMGMLGFRPSVTWCCSHGGTMIIKHRLDENSEAIAAFKGSRYLRSDKNNSARQIIGDYYTFQNTSRNSYHLVSLINTIFLF